MTTASDQATASLLSIFFNNINNGKSIDHALHNVRRGYTRIVMSRRNRFLLYGKLFNSIIVYVGSKTLSIRDNRSILLINIYDDNYCLGINNILTPFMLREGNYGSFHQLDYLSDDILLSIFGKYTKGIGVILQPEQYDVLKKYSHRKEEIENTDGIEISNDMLEDLLLLFDDEDDQELIQFKEESPLNEY